MIRLSFALPVCTLALSGCAVTSPPPAAEATRATIWVDALQPQDRDRIAGLGGAWTRAVAAATRRYAAKVEGEGPLLQAGTALPAVALPPGPYRCRLVRLGGQPAYATYSPDFCYVEARETGMSFDKQTGATRFEGWLQPDSDTRIGFSGSLRPRASVPAPGYGRDPRANVAAVIERVAPFRWRMVLTRAGGGALLDIYELVPVTPAVPGAKPAVPAAT